MNHRETAAARAELLRAALSLAARGWHVFPCLPGRKQPALAVSWQQIATADPAAIHAWWRRSGYNIAIACGPSRLVVLDLDMPGHGGGRAAASAASGADRLADLCRQHDQPYPDATLTVQTPSLGQHLYFRSPPDPPIPNSAGKLAALVDVRGAGGYIIAQGSRTPQGCYKVTRPLPPAPLPEWICELARQPDTPPVPAARPPRPISNGSAYAEAALGSEAGNVAGAKEGTRNDTLFKAARSLGQLVAGGALRADDVRTALAHAAETAGLTRAEITRTIESGLRSGARMPRSPSGR